MPAKLDVNRLLSSAAAAARRAHCPYSRFRVGAAVLTDRGTIYTGCNVENASYGLTLCAERVAVGAAVAGGARKLRAIAVVSGGRTPALPCGACRQVLAEFAGPDLPILAATLRHPRTPTIHTLADLLPHAFRLRPRAG